MQGEDAIFQTKLAFPSTVSTNTFAVNNIISNNHDELLVITMIWLLLGNAVSCAKPEVLKQIH